jgi:hypothetical protein
LINPVVVKAKILLQQIWLLKLDWDKPVPEEFATTWQLFVDELTELNKFGIPRKLIIFNLPINFIELHGLADASSKAYGPAVYVKATDAAGNYSVTLLCAESRVAPIKKITLPRLELNAAVVLCALMNKISEKNSDSKIVLCWLAEPGENWSPYVGHRVNQIQRCSNISVWHHVKLNDNPADVASHGILPRKLRQSELWCHGPQWLKSNGSEWPRSWQNPHNKEDHLLPERKISKPVNIIKTEPELHVLQKFSSVKIVY